MEKRKLRLRQAQLDRMVDYGEIFSTDAGKRVLEDLERSFDGLCYTKGDPYDTAFKNGAREVVLRIKGFLEALNGPIEIEEEKEEEE